MQLLLVEKDSRMTSTYVERVLGFDRDTRTVYLSDCNYRNNSNNSARTAGWKKAMRLYAVRLHCMYNQSVNMRSANCDVRDLLTFTLYGARERTVQQQQQQQQTPRLPDLRAYIPDTTPHAGRYVDGSEAHTPTREPVNAKDDEAFVAHECAWRLRCASYGGLRDMYLRMRDALIADGLHAPVRGGFVAAVDPRNGLHLASLPLYLLRGLYCLRDAMLYTCVHGALIGCNEHGALVVLVKHAYLCITDEWVLVMTEDGKAVRWQPLPQLEAVEYCTSEGSNNNNNNRSSNYSESGHAQRSAASTFVALLASGAAADVVFHVTNAFTADTAAPSLFAAMPRTDMTAEVMRVLDVLRVLRQDNNSSSSSSGADSTTATMLRVVPVSSLSSASASLSDAAASTTSPVTTVRGYVERFTQTHTRALKWQPLPAYADTHATLRSAAALAATLHVAAPSRQAVTRHASFAAYYDEQPPASVEQALGSGVISGSHNNNSHNSSNNSGGGGAEHGDKDGGSGAFAARPPKKKLSRLLHSLYPNEAMY